MEYKNIPMLVIRIGNDERPAALEDIKAAQDVILNALEKGQPIIWPTHHAVNFEMVYVPVDDDGKANVVVDETPTNYPPEDTSETGK